MTQKCCETVYRPGAWHSPRCSRAGKIEREGKFYCSIHDPVARQAKVDARYARFRVENEYRNRQHNFKQDCMDAIRQIAAGHNDPRSLAQSIIDKAEGKSQ